MFFIDFFKRLKDKHGRKTSFLILLSFLSSFVIARIYALLAAPVIIYRHIHFHHLNYGITFLAISGFLSFYFFNSKWRNKIIVLYGVGLGLTFDEFAMWLHLEDQYWMRTSYDAIIIILAILINIVFFGDFWLKLFRKTAYHGSRTVAKSRELARRVKRP